MSWGQGGGVGGGKEGKIARVVAGWRVEPQANRNLSLGAESYVTITLKGFPQCPKFF